MGEKFRKISHYFQPNDARQETLTEPGPSDSDHSHDNASSTAFPSDSIDDDIDMDPSSNPCLDLNNTEKKNEKEKNWKRTSVTDNTFAKWRKEFPWLRKEDSLDGDGKVVPVLVCHICKQYGPKLLAVKVTAKKGIKTSFIEGCSTFKYERVSTHSKSQIHELSLKACQAELKPKETPIVRTVGRISQQEEERMKHLFNTAYYVAENNKAYSDFPGLCNLQKKNNLNLGETYLSDKQCSFFINCISKDIFDQNMKEFSDCDYFSLMSDGTTDITAAETEIAYVNLIKDGVSKIIFLNLQELPSGTAEAIFKQLVFFLDVNVLDWKKKLVEVCFDGTAVNFGEFLGVATRFLEICPGIVKFHCLGHRLELAFKDSVKDDPMFIKAIKLLKGMYKLYHRSPKLLRELKAMAEIMNETIIQFIAIIDIRWVASKQRAFTAYCQNYCTTVVHLENMCENDEVKYDKDLIAKVKGYLQLMKDPDLLEFMFFMLDILDNLSKLSLSVQKDSISVYLAKSRISLTKERLKIFTSGEQVQTKNLKLFHENFDPKNLTYQTIQLSKPKSRHASSSEKTYKRDIATSLIKCIDDRFSDLEENPILKNLHIFDPLSFPSKSDDFVTYGVNEFKEVVDNLPQCILETIDREKVIDEYNDFKMWMKVKSKEHPKASLEDLHSRYLTESFANDENPNMRKIVSFLQVLLVSTAICERGFSCLKLIKTDKRNRLELPSVDTLMRVKLNGPGLKDFDPTNSIKIWWETPSRAPKPCLPGFSHLAEQDPKEVKLGKKRPAKD